MWWRTVVLILLLVGGGALAFFGMGHLMRFCWEDHLVTQLRDQPSFKPQEGPVRDVPSQSFPLARGTLTPPKVELGQQVFRSKCLVCHGDTGRGDGPVGVKLVTKPTDLSSPPIRAQRDTELFQTIAHGKRVMRGFTGDLEDDEIRALVLYIRTLQ